MKNRALRDGRSSSLIFWLLAGALLSAASLAVATRAAAGGNVSADANVSSRTPAPSRKTQPRSQPRTIPGRIRLQPRLVPGEVMRYQIEFQTESEMKHGGAIQDPEGASRVVVTWDATVRLEVLAPASDASPSAQSAQTGGTPAVHAGGAINAAGSTPIRVRTTYEKSTANVSSDTPDPSSDSLKKQYDNLQGLSFEFTLGANGQVSAVHGLEGIITDEKARAAAEQWMSQLSGSSSLPAAGIVPGQHWTSEQAADSMPLAGLSWRTDSTYLRNEPCRPAIPNGAAPEISGDSCAVILTALALDTKHSRDATPEDYRKNGLRTSGSWTGSGESLTYVSLNSGWVVSANETGMQQMEVTVGKPGENAVRIGGTVHTRSTVSLSIPDLGASPDAHPDAPLVASPKSSSTPKP